MDKNTLETHLGEALEKYYQSKVAILEQLKLDDILFDKNFYLLRIQQIWSIQDLLKRLLDAYLQKHEEQHLRNFGNSFQTAKHFIQIL